MVRRIFVINGGIEPLITAEGLFKVKEVDLRVDLLANGKCHRFAVHAQHGRVVDHQVQIGGVQFHELADGGYELVVCVGVFGA